MAVETTLRSYEGLLQAYLNSDVENLRLYHAHSGDFFTKKATLMTLAIFSRLREQYYINVLSPLAKL